MTYDVFISLINSDGETIEVNTSGSTGTPKKILLAKSVMFQSARRTNRFFGITKRSVLHSCISPDFIGGKMVAVRAIEAQCKLSYEEPSNRPELPLPEGFKKADVVSVIPSQMLWLLDNPEILTRGRNYLIGGQALSSDIKEGLAEATERYGFHAWESYGMTETASHIALRAINHESSPFMPLAGIEIDLDHRGCLTVFSPELGKIVTNDMARLVHSEGQCIGFHILGRADNVIISGGKKIHPENLEQRLKYLLKDIKAIEDLMIYSIPDNKWGEALCLRIETHDNAIAGDKKAIDKALKTLPGWERPKHLTFAPLPRTSNGKIRRK